MRPVQGMPQYCRCCCSMVLLSVLQADLEGRLCTMHPTKGTWQWASLVHSCSNPNEGVQAPTDAPPDEQALMAPARGAVASGEAEPAAGSAHQRVLIVSGLGIPRNGVYVRCGRRYGCG